MQHYTGNVSTPVSKWLSYWVCLLLINFQQLIPAASGKARYRAINPLKEMFIKQTEHTFTHMYKTPADGTAGCHGDEA